MFPCSIIPLPNATIAPWWDDLIHDDARLGRYTTEGQAPNRTYTAEWLQVPTYYEDAHPGSVSR